jgi:hypothetical protein
MPAVQQQLGQKKSNVLTASCVQEGRVLCLASITTCTQTVTNTTVSTKVGKKDESTGCQYGNAVAELCDWGGRATPTQLS